MNTIIGTIYKEPTQWAVDVTIDGVKSQLTFGPHDRPKPTQAEIGAAVAAMAAVPVVDAVGSVEKAMTDGAIAYELKYSNIGEVWRSLTQKQKSAYLAANPLLARLLSFASKFAIMCLLMVIFSANLEAATRTTTQDGAWETAATWGGTAPVDGDTAVIGHAVTYATDMTAYGTGVIITINSGGSLTATTTAGAYYIKCAGNITVNTGGSFLVGSVGSPYPATCTLTVNLNGARYFTGAGTIAIYCAEPTVKTLVVNTTTAANATVIDVRLVGGGTWDPTADAGNWVFAQTVQCDNYGGSAASSTVRTIDSTSRNELTLNTGTMPIKNVNSLIHLINRNVWITGATGYAFSSASAVSLVAQISGNTNGLTNCNSVTISGGTLSGNSSGLLGCNSVTISGGTLSGNSSGLNSCYGATISGGTLSGNTYGLSSCYGATISGGTISGNSNGIGNCAGATISGGTISGNTYGLRGCSGGITDTAFFENASGDIYGSYSNLKNTLLGSITEVFGYTGASAPPTGYVSSIDHDQSADAFKSWSKGGIVVKQTGTVTTGYAYAYQLTCADSSNWGFYQLEKSIPPGQSVRWIVYRNQSVDTASKAEIVALGNDPLISGQTALATATFTTGAGAWEAKQIEYTNTGTMPIQAMIRVSGKAASGTLTFLPVFVHGRESW